MVKKEGEQEDRKEGEGEEITLLAKLSDGRCFPVTVPRDTSVADMRETVYGLLEGRFRIGRMRCNRKIMQPDSALLSACGVRNESVVSVELIAPSTRELRSGGGTSKIPTTEEEAAHEEEEEEAKFVVIVKLPSGRALSLRVSEHTTLQQLRDLIVRSARRDEGVGEGTVFELHHHHEPLPVEAAPERSIDSCGIRNESAIAVVLKPLFLASPYSFWASVGAWIAAVFGPPSRAVWRPVSRAFNSIWRLLTWLGTQGGRFLAWIPRPRPRPAERTGDPLLRRIWDATARSCKMIWDHTGAPVWRLTVRAGNATGRQLDRFFRSLGNSVIRPLWNHVLWPVLRGIGRAIRWVWRKIGDLFSWIDRQMYRFFRFLSLSVIRPLWNRAIWPMLRGIGRAIRWVWRKFGDLFSWIDRQMGRFFRFLGNSIIRPLWNRAIWPMLRGIGRAIRWAWNHVLYPTIRWIGRKLERIFRFLGTNIVRPIWNRVVRRVLVWTIRKIASALTWIIHLVRIPQLLHWLTWRGIHRQSYWLDVRPHVVVRQHRAIPEFGLRDGAHYTVTLRNDSYIVCRCDLFIDGQKICSLLLHPRSTYRIERPPDSEGRFTFRLSEEARAAAAAAAEGGGGADFVPDPADPDAGTVVARFVPQLTSRWRMRRTYAGKGPLRSKGRAAPSSFASSSVAQGEEDAEDDGDGHGVAVAGRTALEGHSDQNFARVFGMEFDEERSCTITVRLAGFV